MDNHIRNLNLALNKIGEVGASDKVSGLIKSGLKRPEMIGNVTTAFDHETLGPIMVGIYISVSTWNRDMRSVFEAVSSAMPNQEDLDWDASSAENRRQDKNILVNASYVIGQEIASSGALNSVNLPRPSSNNTAVVPIKSVGGSSSYAPNNAKKFDNNANGEYPEVANAMITVVNSIIAKHKLNRPDVTIHTALYNFSDVR